MKSPLLFVLFCYTLVYASTDGEPASSSEKEESGEQKKSYETGDTSGDLCEVNNNVQEECKICEMLNLPESAACCSDPDALLMCHVAVQEVMDEDEESHEDRYEDSDEGESEESSEEENEIEKRFGSLFSNWQWYSHRNDRHFDNNVAEAKRGLEKRYGNLFGSLFTDRKLSQDKRYGILFRNLFGRRGDRNKRYGNLMGRLFSRYNDDKRDGELRKRYGSLFRPLFSSKDKRYGSLSRPLFGEIKRYGSLMGKVYGAQKFDDKKRSTDLEKRYGSLMGRPFSSKKLGKR